MEKATLELILSNALAAAANELDLEDSRVVVLPDGVRLESLEPYQLHRNRFKGHMFTRSLSDFCSYVRQHGKDYSDDEELPPIFIDQGNMSATIFFDMGTRLLPGHCDDSATVTLTPTAAFNRLGEMLGRPLSQAQLIEWLEDWAPNLLAYSGDDSMTMGAAIAAVRRITVNETRKSETVLKPFYSSASTLDEVETSSADVLPDSLVLLVSCYDGLPIEEIKIHLSSLSAAAAPAFKLRWKGEEAQREEVAKAFKLSVADSLGEDFAHPLIVGQFRKS